MVFVFLFPLDNEKIKDNPLVVSCLMTSEIKKSDRKKLKNRDETRKVHTKMPGTGKTNTFFRL